VRVGRRGLAAAIVAVVVLVLALNSCGKTRLSAPALRRDASKVCTIARKRVDAIGLPKSSKTVARFLERGLAALEPELTELRLLDPPSAAEPTYTRGLDAFALELAAMRAALTQLNGGGDPIEVFRALQARLGPLETRANGAFHTLQIDACMVR
jgi:hypothetical protein